MAPQRDDTLTNEEAAPAATAPAMNARSQTFWNAYTNIRNQIDESVGPGGYDPYRELLTYIQADPRYVDHFQAYIDFDPSLTAEERSDMINAAYDTRDSSVKFLNETPNFSTDVQAAANDFYFAIDQSYPAAPSAPAIPGLDFPAQPLTQGQVDLGPAPAIPAPDIDMLGDLANTPATPIATVTEALSPDAAPPVIDTTPVPAMPTTTVSAPPALATAPVVDDELGAEQVVTASADADTQQQPNDVSEYTVQKGDNIWNIVKDHYGLESNKDIMKAVESIARENGLEKGADANHIDVGQVLNLPDNPFKQGQNLDWAALDRDTKVSSGFNRAFDVAAVGAQTPNNINAAPSAARSAPRPSDLSLTS